ncbi:Stage 0 sporulation protein YaaT [Olavius algarvensis associated proteobacterium Delta 3]|nr:Stage 0 sporulation protein YaaT [Olavius algarvensis associated proteobacterium Delta 3]
MTKIVGIRFKPTGKIYDFDPGAFVLKPGERVIVETEKGLGFGTVAVAPRPLDENGDKRPQKKVYRLATEQDFKQQERNRRTEAVAHEFCMACIRDLDLEMNLFSVESTFDASRLTFFFTAEGRVDFRQLVKMLVKKFRTRIEMRQVGIRNQAKMCGGLGRCGRVLCCSTFIDKFEPVSIRMAKEQNLSLNPTKSSGLCGRLMCCLNYENATYQKLKENYPRVGTSVVTGEGTGKIVRLNVICSRVSIKLETGAIVEKGLNQFTIAKEKSRK